MFCAVVDNCGGLDGADAGQEVELLRPGAVYVDEAGALLRLRGGHGGLAPRDGDRPVLVPARGQDAGGKQQRRREHSRGGPRQTPHVRRLPCIFLMLLFAGTDCIICVI